ncbi:MAG TPA: 50S ribosomal protein L13 [Thermoplasmata archaeon]
MAIIDAERLVLGRLCTHVAKRLLNGEEIVVINAEKAIVSGNRAQLIKFYKHKRERGTRNKGPFYPRTPDRLIKRSVRGMVERYKPRGRNALKRLRVYIGVPKQFAGVAAETVEGAKKPHLEKYVFLGDITKELGAAQEMV